MLLSLITLSAPTMGAESFEDKTFYFGDMHVHTAASGDAHSSELGPDLGRGCNPSEHCGAEGGLLEQARAYGLDFIATTDHTNGPNAGDARAFKQVIDLMLDGNDPEGGFITIPGAELHYALQDGHELGHQSLYFFGDDRQLRDLTIDDARFNGASKVQEACEDRWPWMENLERGFGPALLVPHHPAAIGTGVVDWDCYDFDRQPTVEVYSQHGNSLSVASTYDPLSNGTAESGVVHHLLGLEGGCGALPTPGFIASTDDHYTVAGAVCEAVGYRYAGGLAAVVLERGEALTRQAIYDAMVDRRTYATSGPAVPVLVDYYSDGAWIGTSGQEMRLAFGEGMEARLRLPAELDEYVLGVDLVTSRGERAFTSQGGGRWSYEVTPPPEWFYPRVRIDGRAWYGEGYPCEDAGTDYEERIWLSPARVVITSCGGCSAAPAGRSGLVLLFLAWSLRRRRA